MSNDNAQNTDQSRPAVGVPVERIVRPYAWAHESGHLMLADSTKTGAEDLLHRGWAPLYDQAALDAAVEQANARQNAAWRLMCEKMVAAERERLAAEFTKRAEALNTTGAGCAPHIQAQYEAMAGELLDWAGVLRA